MLDAVSLDQFAPLFELSSALLIVFWGVFFAAIGSAIGAFTYRWPRQQQQLWESEAREILALPEMNVTLPSFYQGRSQCTECQHTLGIKDLVPILSYLLVRGRCRHCDHKISSRYPLIEIGMVILGLAVLSLTFSPLEKIVSLIILSMVYIASIIDFEHLWLPDFSAFMIVLMTIVTLTNHPTILISHLYAGMTAFLLFASVRWIYLHWRHVEALGFGDVKFFAALCVWLGPQFISSILLIASFTGIGYVVLRGRPYSRQLPFGPFLGIAAIVAFFVENLV